MSFTRTFDVTYIHFIIFSECTILDKSFRTNGRLRFHLVVVFVSVVEQSALYAVSTRQ